MNNMTFLYVFLHVTCNAKVNRYINQQMNPALIQISNMEVNTHLKQQNKIKIYTRV